MVTIVIPCFNQGQYLAEAIESALKQTVKCQVIVVIDGSEDNSEQIARKYPVKIIIQPNYGLATARNVSIRAAETEYILPLDADDKLHPTMVEKCLEVEADIVGTAQETFGDYTATTYFNPNPTHEMFLAGNQINCSALFKKSMWEKLGGYDETMTEGYEDWDFWVRATKAGYSVKTIPILLLYYRKHGDSLVTKATSKHQEIHQYILNKIK
jgi:glycosyltransferase involved in cell wall biosynthesis